MEQPFSPPPPNSRSINYQLFVTNQAKFQKENGLGHWWQPHLRFVDMWNPIVENLGDKLASWKSFNCQRKADSAPTLRFPIHQVSAVTCSIPQVLRFPIQI